MVQEWLTKGVFLYLMAGVCGVGVVLRVLLSAYYNRQLHWTQKMAAVRKKWLIRMREDYEDCMDADGRVNNVDIFVDKYIEGKKFMGILLSTWDKIGGQAWILCAGLLAVSAVSSVFYQVDREAVLFTFFIGTWTVIVNIVVDNIANLTEKKNQIKRNLVDYFENRMSTLEEDMFPEEEGEPDFGMEMAEEKTFETEDFAFAREKDAGAGALQKNRLKEGDAPESAMWSRTAESDEKGSSVQENAVLHGQEEEEFSRSVHIQHISKSEGAAQQSAALEEGMGIGKSRSGKSQPPKFFVVSGADRRAAQEEKEEESASVTDVENAGSDEPGKKARRESKKEMMARKKREHIKYELKREITQDARRERAEQNGGYNEEETAAATAEAATAEKETEKEPAPQEAKKTSPKEAVQQLAAALELLKRENALDEAAPLLAEQIGKDQENGALIEEVLREFLV